MKSRSPAITFLSLLLLAAMIGAGTYLYLGGTESGSAPDPQEALTVAPPVKEPIEAEFTATPEEAKPRQDLSPIETAPAKAVYVLRDPDYRLLIDVSVALAREGRLLMAGRTDERGELEYETGGEGSAELLVLAPRFAPGVHEVPLTPGRHELRLERGLVVSGRVVVNGRSPEEVLALTLISTRPLLDLEAALGLTWEEAQGVRGRATRISGETSVDGTFCFSGLPTDWSGQLRLPRRYRLKDRSLAADSWGTSLALERPAERLLVELTKPLRILGQVVSRKGGNPVADAVVTPKLVYREGAESRKYLDDVHADDEGWFEIPLESNSLLGESLTLYPENHAIERILMIEPVELTEDWDLGEVPLRASGGSLELPLLVQEHAGIPVAGALATTLSSHLGPGAPTDVEGRTVLEHLEEGPTVLRVVALGYEVLEQPIFVRPEAEELVVTLTRGTLLRLRILLPDGTPAKRVKAGLTTLVYPFKQEIRWPLLSMLREVGVSLHTRARIGDGFTFRFNRAMDLESEWIVIDSLRPGLPMTLHLLSGFGRILEVRELEPLSEEEQRSLEIVLERAPKSLTGVVLDEQGRPLAQASVGVSYQEELGSPERGATIMKGVDEDGRFKFGEIYLDSLWFSARAPGHVPFWNQEYAIPADGSPVEIRLEKGRATRVTVVDELGRPLEAALSAKLPTGSMALGRNVAPGQYVLDGLTETDLTVVATVHQLKHEHALGAHQTELVITLPAPGRVEATVHLPEGGIGPGESRYVLLLPGGEKDNARYHRFPETVRRPSEVVFEGVLPGRFQAVARRYAGGEPDDWEALCAPVWIEVHADRTTRVELWP